MPHTLKDHNVADGSLMSHQRPNNHVTLTSPPSMSQLTSHLCHTHVTLVSHPHRSTWLTAPPVWLCLWWVCPVASLCCSCWLRGSSRCSSWQQQRPLGATRLSHARSNGEFCDGRGAAWFCELRLLRAALCAHYGVQSEVSHAEWLLLYVQLLGTLQLLAVCRQSLQGRFVCQLSLQVLRAQWPGTATNTAAFQSMLLEEAGTLGCWCSGGCHHLCMAIQAEACL